MTLISVLILVLFAFTFFDWWVLSGKDPDQILALFNGGKATSSQGFPVSTEETQAPGVVVYPATYTPQPLPTLTFTPAPTINPFFAGIFQQDVPPEKLLDLPSIATAAIGKGMIAFQGSDGQIFILDAVYETLADFTLPSSQPSQMLAFSDDGQYLANAEIKGKITVWTTLTKPWEEAVILSLNSTGQTVLIKQLTFTPDNSGLLVGYCNSFENECIEMPRLVLFDIPSGAERFSQSGYDHAAFGNNNVLAVWGQNKTATEIRYLSLQNGTMILSLASSFPPEGEGWVVADISLDSSRAGAISTNGLMRIWDIATGAVVAEWTSSVSSPDQILFSPDLTQVAIANDQSMAEVWDIASASKLIDFNLKADYGQFFWTSDWKLLCVRTVKPSMSIWDVMSLQSLEDIVGPESKIKEILFLPKNHKMLVITETGNISLWRSDLIR
jgi:WD40 repeat protein